MEDANQSEEENTTSLEWSQSPFVGLISDLSHDDKPSTNQGSKHIGHTSGRYEEPQNALLESSFVSKGSLQRRDPSGNSEETKIIPRNVSADNYLTDDFELRHLICRGSPRTVACCKDCGRPFQEINKLSSLLLAEKTEEISKQQSLILRGHYRCKICSEITDEIQDMRRHILDHISEGEVACEQCLRNAKLNIEATRNTVQCAHCYKNITDTSKVATRPLHIVAESSQKNSASRLDSHSKDKVVAGAGQSVIICEDCEIGMNRRKDSASQDATLFPLKIPLVYFSKPVECKTCNKVFSDVGQIIKEFVTVEMRQSVTALNIMRNCYTCGICNLRSSTSLNEHVDEHAASKDFYCSDCLAENITNESSGRSRGSSISCQEEKSSTSSSSEKDQNRCSQCHSRLDMSEDLASGLMHCELDTDQHLYYYHCNVCKERRSSKCLLTRHLKKHVKENAVKCLKCKAAERRHSQTK